ncbi:DNA binding [Basidiobolus ranarum]|uniref:DNA binding n=1 Tax=Basidiobolus ranarum TaxID=34480 RepID=A0ABR2WHC0_9FUNG
MFPDRRQNQGLNQSLGQGLNPISTYSPLDTYNTRQFDPSGFDNRNYLNPTATWKENGSLFQQVDTDVSSSNLQNSLLQNEGHNGLSSIPPSSTAYSSQSLRMLNNGDPQLPYFNQAPLASVSQQAFPNYQSMTTPSNNQSPGMSVAHMSPATTETSFIRRYPGGPGIMGGMDPLNLTSEMNYPNQGYTTQLNGLDTFGRNALNPFVDNTNANLELKPRVNPEFQYNSRNGNGNGNSNGNTHNLVDNPNSISNESHLQVDHNYNHRCQPGTSTNGNNSNLIQEIIQPTNHGVVNHSLKHNGHQEIEPQKYSQPLASVQHSAYSTSPFPGNGTITPGQISMSPEYQESEKIQDEMLPSSSSSTTTQFKDRTPSTSVKTKASKEKSKNSKPIPSNLTPPGQKLKRPMNAFLIYASQRRPQLQETDPTMTTAAQSKILGDEWAKMEDSRKLDYVERARSLKT